MALMRLSARADYALRAAIELAAASSGHVTADQLARAQQIPGKFLETILAGGMWPGDLLLLEARCHVDEGRTIVVEMPA